MQGVSLNPVVTAQPQAKAHSCDCHDCCCCQSQFTKPQIPDSFEKSYVGIIPPKDYKPDPFAGLGPELSPQEKLKKKWEDLRKPMYANVPKAEPKEETEKKSFGQKVLDKVKDFGQKVKNFVTNLFHKPKTEG